VAGAGGEHGPLTVSGFTRVVVLLGTVFLSATSPALLPAAQAATDDDSASAIRWLERAATAPDRVSYRGTQFVTSWGPQGASSALLGIVHSAEQGSQISVLGAGANTGVKAFVQPHLDASRATVDGSPLTLLTATYRLVDAGDSVAAGRSAAVVEARRSDGSLAARFWIDKKTALLLQRYLYTVDGRELVRATVFTDLQIEKSDFTGHLPPMLPSGGGEDIDTSQAAALRAEGWACSYWLSDSLRLYDVHRAGGTLRFSYSDGLFNLSVFEQRGELDPGAVAGYQAAQAPGGAMVYVRYGMPSYAVWSSGGIVFTLVGDIPYDVMDRVVRAYPHEVPKRDGILDRVGNGLARMTTWLTPVGAFAGRLG
jgi:sigma-E factor negative regulatory protein RseB